MIEGVRAVQSSTRTRSQGEARPVFLQDKNKNTSLVLPVSATLPHFLVWLFAA